MADLSTNVSAVSLAYGTPPPSMGELPTGTVTFLVSDIEGSCPLMRERYTEALDPPSVDSSSA